jgi:hypothetical protein
MHEAPAPHRPGQVRADAGWSGAGRRHDRPFVLSPRTAPGGLQRPADGCPGLEVSLVQLPQHVDIERSVGDDLLEALVLSTQLLELFGVICLHPAVLIASAVPSGLCDLEVTDLWVPKMSSSAATWTLTAMVE